MTAACAPLLAHRPALGPAARLFAARSWSRSAAEASEPRLGSSPPWNLARVASVDEAVELERERQLCERARAGDRDALASLLREHGPRLYRSVLLPRLGNVAAAEEALAQTYMKVVERIGQFTWQNVGFYPWLRMVGLHVALDQLRKHRRETLFEPSDLSTEIDRSPHHELGPNALEQYDQQETRRQVESLLAELNPRYALAIRLRILEERSRESAALELGVSVGTLDVVLHRAMAALKKALAARRAAHPDGGGRP